MIQPNSIIVECTNYDRSWLIIQRFTWKHIPVSAQDGNHSTWGTRQLQQHAEAEHIYTLKVIEYAMTEDPQLAAKAPKSTRC